MICTPKQTYDVNENVDFIEKRARMEDFMCTAATYRTKDFYFGRTLDYEFSYGEEIAVTPRNYPFHFHHTKDLEKHYAIIGMAHMAGDLSLIKLAVALVQGFVYLSLAGGVWCIGYMLSDHFRKDE